MEEDFDHYDDFGHADDDGLDEDGNFTFECAAFMVDGRLYCPIAGTEECDWDCPG